MVHLARFQIPSAACSRTWLLYSSMSRAITRSAYEGCLRICRRCPASPFPLHRSTIPFDSGCLALVRMSRQIVPLTTARNSLLQNSLP